MLASRVTSSRLLIVEDDPSTAVLITQALAALGIRPQIVSNCRDAERALFRGQFACVVIDLGLPDGNGLEVHQSLAGRRDPPPIVFVSADDQAASASRVLGAGAVAYVVKRPAYLDLLRDTVIKLVRYGGRGGGSDETPTEPSGIEPGEQPLIGNSPPMRELRNKIDRCAGGHLAVLVTGETGTGKELVARAIHRAGPSPDAPFVAVNCAAIAGSLFESELFGSVRGAFTGAVRDRGGLFGAADNGTILLDEIGELPLDAQAKLLRVLEDQSYRRVGDTREIRARARVVVATNRDLAREVQRGTFREDLFYRLDVIGIDVPPLRERVADLPILVDHFLAAEAEQFGRRSVSRAALEQLRVHPWPGNVRELRHAITRTLLSQDEVEIARFELRIGGRPQVLPRDRQRLGWTEVAEALREHRGRLRPSAEALHVSVRTLQRRMRDLEMSAQAFR